MSKQQHQAPGAEEFRALVSDQLSAGLCLECGAWASGVDPDLEDGVCEMCSAPAVMGRAAMDRLCPPLEDDDDTPCL